MKKVREMSRKRERERGRELGFRSGVVHIGATRSTDVLRTGPAG